MFRAFLLLSVLAVAVAFGPPFKGLKVTQPITSSVKIGAQKTLAALTITASLFAGPAIAVEGTGPKQDFFGGYPASSPFPNTENREDPIYSPYSPYGDGSAAAYNKRKGTADELAFWKGVFAESERRVAKVPGYAAKKTWTEITTELTRYTYSMRESMLRLAASAPDSKSATAAAKVYFSDLNDMFEWANKKRSDIVTTSYEKSVKDLAAFKALVK